MRWNVFGRGRSDLTVDAPVPSTIFVWSAKRALAPDFFDLASLLSAGLREVSHLRDASFLSQIAPAGGVLLVDLDSFKSLNSVVDDLISVRQANPRLMVILVHTKGFTQNSTDSYRLPICDATIALPGPVLETLDLLSQACANNVIWQKRMLEQDTTVVMFPTGAVRRSSGRPATAALRH